MKPLKFASLPMYGFVAELIMAPTSIREARARILSTPEFFQASFLQLLKPQSTSDDHLFAFVLRRWHEICKPITERNESNPKHS